MADPPEAKEEPKEETLGDVAADGCPKNSYELANEHKPADWSASELIVLSLAFSNSLGFWISRAQSVSETEKTRGFRIVPLVIDVQYTQYKQDTRNKV